MQWTALNLGDSEPELLGLNVFGSEDDILDNALILDLHSGEVCTSWEIMKALKESDLLRAEVLTMANFLHSKKWAMAKLPLSISKEGLHTTYAFQIPECLNAKESTMAKSAAIQILSKKKQAAEAEEAVDVEEEAVGEDEGSEEEDETEDADTEVESESAEEVVEEKPKAASKVKSEGATTTKTKTAASTATDDIVATATEIENLTEAKALKVLGEMVEAKSFDEFRMGGILSRIQSEGWIGEYENFRSFIEAEYDFKYRTAMYWIAIYNNLVESGVAWSKVKRLGWTKLKELSSILTKENVSEILKDVTPMNVMQVIAYVAEYNKTGDTTAAAKVTEGEQLKTKSFKLFEGQKESVDIALEKAKEASGTDSDAVALEYICVNYASGAAPKPKTKKAAEAEAPSIDMPTTGDELVPFIQSVADQFDESEIEAALGEIFSAITAVFPDATIEAKLD